MVVNTGTRLFDMLNDEVMTDITFVVQGTEIKGHRVVASSQGGVLRELLENCKDNRVEISQDIAPHTFKTVLQYLYTDICEVSDLNLFEVTYAAKTLDLDGLERRCAETIKGKLSASNVGAFTSQALLFDAKENTKVCQEYFGRNTLKVIKTKEFLEIPADVLLTLCSTDGIACSELELFLGCVEWAKSECGRQKREETSENIRAVLGDVLNKIRFPCMPKKDFEDVVVPLEILTYEEVGRIVVGWKKKKKRSLYLDEFRTETVKVTVKDYRIERNSIYQDTILPSVPLSTTISELKAMKIFNGCREQYPVDTFTLSNKGRELADDVTLASIHTPGEEFVFEVHSVTFKIQKDGHKGWVPPVTIKTADLFGNGVNIVKGHIYGYKGISPDNIQGLSVNGKNFAVYDRHDTVYYDRYTTAVIRRITSGYPGAIIDVSLK